MAERLHGGQFSRFFTRKIIMVEPSRYQGLLNILENLEVNRMKYKSEVWCPITFNEKGQKIPLLSNTIGRLLGRARAANGGSVNQAQTLVTAVPQPLFGQGGTFLKAGAGAKKSWPGGGQVGG